LVGVITRVLNAFYFIFSTIQCAFIAVARVKKICKDVGVSQCTLLLFLLGTDQLEQLFSSVRTMTHAKNCNILELTERLNMAIRIERILNENPHLRQKIRISVSRCLTEDHSSVENWNGNLNAYDIDISFNWKRVMKKAIKILREDFKYSDIELDTTNLHEIITVRHPLESFNDTLDEGNNENDDYLDNIEQNCLISKENDLDEVIIEELHDYLPSEEVSKYEA
jgi:hypothetical protein